MFSLSSAQPLPTAPLAIPDLNLSGRAPPRNATVGLDHVDKPADMTQWAEFHNGVAAGLKIAASISEVSECKCALMRTHTHTHTHSWTPPGSFSTVPQKKAQPMNMLVS